MSDYVNHDIDADLPEFPALEALIRRAGDYVEVSSDLRPRTLEEARARHRETQLHRSLAMAIVVAGLLLCGLQQLHGSRRDYESRSPFASRVSLSADELLEIAGQKSQLSGSEPAWCLAEAFSELRQRQSQLFARSF